MNTYLIYWESDTGEWYGPVECTADNIDQAHKEAEDNEHITGRYRIESA